MEKAKALEPTVRIGKLGVTEGQINEIKKQLEKRKIIKIKFLRSFVEDKDKKKEIDDIAERTNSKVVQSIGNVVVLIKD